MTFFEYLVSRYLGSPTRVVGSGESYWPCPECGSEKFHTMPVKPEYKHRAKCWSCDFGGDAADMLKKFHPNEPYHMREERLRVLRREYESTFSPEDRGESYGADSKYWADVDIKGNRDMFVFRPNIWHVTTTDENIRNYIRACRVVDAARESRELSIERYGWYGNRKHDAAYPGIAFVCASGEKDMGILTLIRQRSCSLRSLLADESSACERWAISLMWVEPKFRRKRVALNLLVEASSHLELDPLELGILNDVAIPLHGQRLKALAEKLQEECIAT